jgi:hypothetical protein
MSVIIQLSLWDYLDTASKTPVDADWFGLLDRVEESIEGMPILDKLAVAGDAIARLVPIYSDRCAVRLEEIGYLSHPEQEPCLPLDAFDIYVRRSSFVNLEQFIESPELPAIERGYERGSVVRELSVVEALAGIGDEIGIEPVDSETAYQEAIGLAHDEDVSAWGRTISARLDEWNRPVALLELQGAIEMPLVQVWLALLLNGMRLEQRGDFYQTEQVWIVR